MAKNSLSLDQMLKLAENATALDDNTASNTGCLYLEKDISAFEDGIEIRFRKSYLPREDKHVWKVTAEDKNYANLLLGEVFVDSVKDPRKVKRIDAALEKAESFYSRFKTGCARFNVGGDYLRVRLADIRDRLKR